MLLVAELRASRALSKPKRAEIVAVISNRKDFREYQTSSLLTRLASVAFPCIKLYNGQSVKL
jgi:hypothetical protein